MFSLADKLKAKGEKVAANTAVVDKPKGAKPKKVKIKLKAKKRK